MINLIGKKINKLKILEKVINKNGNISWLCLCNCGNKTIVNHSHLRNGHTKSCGCLKIEKAKTGNSRRTHGKTHTKIYNAYIGIIRRCNNKKDKGYKNYGGRGIKCEWKSFEEFYKDIGDIPKGGFSIERINNDGNYCKSNCKWATKSEQNNNRRSSHYITFEGKTLTMKTWADIKKINYKAFSGRIRNGWTIERAFTQKYRKMS